MTFPEGDAQARSTADAVARRSYGKLVAFLAARTRDVAVAEDALRRHSLRRWRIGR
jgi:RNA polymerase sigma-70 factor (ECF subfamily)